MPVMLPRLNPSGNVILGMKMDMYDRHARSVLTFCRSQMLCTISLDFSPVRSHRGVHDGVRLGIG
jgi:hypothetical protein